MTAGRMTYALAPVASQVYLLAGHAAASCAVSSSGRFEPDGMISKVQSNWRPPARLYIRLQVLQASPNELGCARPGFGAAVRRSVQGDGDGCSDHGERSLHLWGGPSRTAGRWGSCARSPGCGVLQVLFIIYQPGRAGPSAVVRRNPWMPSAVMGISPGGRRNTEPE